MAKQTKPKNNKKVSKTKPRKKTFSVWAGILVVLVVAAVGILVIRFSNAGTDIRELSFYNCSTAREADVTVDGFKPKKQYVCDVNNSDTNIKLPRSLRPNEKACFWGAGSGASSKIIQSGPSTSQVRVTTYNTVNGGIGIYSCFVNKTGSNIDSITVKSTDKLISLTNVSYGY